MAVFVAVAVMFCPRLTFLVVAKVKETLPAPSVLTLRGAPSGRRGRQAEETLPRQDRRPGERFGCQTVASDERCVNSRDITS